MLKVNTERIGVEEFAIKYHLFPIVGGTKYTTLNQGNWTIAMEIKQCYVWITVDVEYGDCEETLDDEALNLLFEMIKSGDVIKEEENQC